MENIKSKAGSSKRKYQENKNAASSKKLKLSKSKECSKKPTWQDYELLAELHNLEINAAKQIIELFEDGNTIPFIARYRKQQIDNMSPEQLRDVKITYSKICDLKNKIPKVLQNLNKIGICDENLENIICSATSMDILEHLYAPYKSKKNTLADRAKELCLDQPASDILKCKSVNLHSFINSEKDGLKNIEQVSKGIQHVIAQVIAVNLDVITFVKNHIKTLNVLMKTVKAKQVEAKSGNSKDVEEKFRNYFDYEIPVKYIKPHQVLAINRGEKLKILKVKLVIPDFFPLKLKEFCWKLFKVNSIASQFKPLMEEAILDSYTRLLRPLIIKEIRKELNTKAENASYSVFSANVKQLFLATPLKGKNILAIDPGFKGGCKLAVVSDTGAFLEGEVIFPHTSSDKNVRNSAATLKKLINKYSCLIAIGDGTACRETEIWLSNLIENGTFAPVQVQYTIVSECGASIYSCSKEAKAEFPNMDINIISAVSLARRLQDPMAELVKIEPYHLGVGMYQHDLNKKQLCEVLDETVEECVSFIGVDVNTTSHYLLKRVAGLGDVRAKNILQHREKNGPLLNRNELLNVKGIGQSVYKQCAGFIRICPASSEVASAFYENKNTDPLDSTWIHPESYGIASEVARHFDVDLRSIGSERFMQTVRENKTKLHLKDLAKKCECDEANLKLILDVFERPLDHDLRSEAPIKPLFRSGVQKFESLKVGDVLSGRVNNCTHFGCFVDVGVGQNGLIHSSKLGAFHLNVGDQVEVKVANVDIPRKRLQLLVVRLL